MVKWLVLGVALLLAFAAAHHIPGHPHPHPHPAMHHHHHQEGAEEPDMLVVPEKTSEPMVVEEMKPAMEEEDKGTVPEMETSSVVPEVMSFIYSGLVGMIKDSIPEMAVVKPIDMPDMVEQKIPVKPMEEIFLPENMPPKPIEETFIVVEPMKEEPVKSEEAPMPEEPIKESEMPMETPEMPVKSPEMPEVIMIVPEMPEEIMMAPEMPMDAPDMPVETPESPISVPDIPAEHMEAPKMPAEPAMVVEPLMEAEIIEEFNAPEMSQEPMPEKPAEHMETPEMPAEPVMTAESQPLMASEMAEKPIKAPEMPEELIKAPEMPMDTPQMPMDTAEIPEEPMKIPEMVVEPIKIPEISEEPMNNPEMAEESIKTPEMTEEIIKTPAMPEESTNISEMAEEPINIPEMTEEIIKTPEMAEEQTKTPEMAEQPMKTPEMAEEAVKTPAVPAETVMPAEEMKPEEVSDPKETYEGAQLLRVTATTDEQKELLDRLEESRMVDTWLRPAKGKGMVDIMVPLPMLESVKMRLADVGAKYTVVITDVQRAIAEENPTMSPDEEQEFVGRKGHRMTWTSYNRLDVIHEYLNYLAQTYPDLCSVTTIGSSVEGKPLKLLRISSRKGRQASASRPAFWIDGGIHAREWISPASVAYIIQELVENHDSHGAIAENIDYYVLPVVNPDGYEYTHQRERLWRKNRKDPSLGRCAGTDLNRNWGYKWGGAGSSRDKCKEIYAGANAFSEPETQAIRNFVTGQASSIKGYVTFHSYGQYILYPWGYDRKVPPDYMDLDRVGKKAASAMRAAGGASYQVGNSASLLYPASGGADDWAKGGPRIKYTYTIELRDRGQYGFLLPAQFITPTAKEAFAAIKTIAQEILSSP